MMIKLSFANKQKEIVTSREFIDDEFPTDYQKTDLEYHELMGKILNETDKGRYITSASHVEGLKALRMSQSLKKPKKATKECSKSSNKLLTVSTILGKQEDAEPIKERNLALYEEVA